MAEPGLSPTFSEDTNDSSDADLREKPKARTSRPAVVHKKSGGTVSNSHSGLHSPPSFISLSGELHRSKESCMHHHGHNEESQFHHLLRCLAEEHDRELEMLKKALHAAYAENIVETHERKRRSARSTRHSSHMREPETNSKAQPALSPRGSLMSSETKASAASCKPTASTGEKRGIMSSLWHKGGDAIRRTLSDRNTKSRKAHLDDYFSSAVHPETAPPSRPASASPAKSRVQDKYAGDDSSADSAAARGRLIGANHASRHSNKDTARQSNKAPAANNAAVTAPANASRSSNKHLSEEAQAFKRISHVDQESDSDSDSESSEEAGRSSSDSHAGTASKPDRQEKPNSAGEPTSETGQGSPAKKAASGTSSAARATSSIKGSLSNNSATKVSHGTHGEAVANTTTARLPEKACSKEFSQEARDGSPKQGSPKQGSPKHGEARSNSECSSNSSIGSMSQFQCTTAKVIGQAGSQLSGTEATAAGAADVTEGTEAEKSTTEAIDEKASAAQGKRKSEDSLASDERNDSDASITPCRPTGSDKDAAGESCERSATSASSDASLPAADGSGSKLAVLSPAQASGGGESARKSLSSDCEVGSVCVGTTSDSTDTRGEAHSGHLRLSIMVPNLEAADGLAMSQVPSNVSQFSSNRGSMMSEEPTETDSWVGELGALRSANQDTPDLELAERNPGGLAIRTSVNNGNAARRVSLSGRRGSMPSIDEQTAGGHRRRMSFNAQMQQTDPPTATLNIEGAPGKRKNGGSILKKNGALSSGPRNSARHRISFDQAVTSFERTCVEIIPGRNSAVGMGGKDAPEAISLDHSAIVTLRDCDQDYDEEEEEERIVYITRPLWATNDDEEDKSGRQSVDSREGKLRKRRTSRLRKLFGDEPSIVAAHPQLDMLKSGTFTEEDEQKLILQEQSRIRRILSPPNSTFNFYFDLMSIFFIAMDILVIPLGVFKPEENFVTDVLSYMTTLFWSCDLIRNFFVGHFKKGKVVMDGQAIMWNYLLSWFVLDFSIVMLDWTMLVVKIGSGGESSASDNKATNILRSLRNVRTLRLLRSMKASHLLKLIEDRINSEVVSVVWTLGKLFGIIIVVNHLIACGWYWIGEKCIGDVPNWVEGTLMSPGSELLEPGEFQLHTKSLAYRYFTSFHWATTHFVSSQISIEPNNIFERVFAIIVVFFALVAVSSFVGGLTSAVMHLGSMSSAKSKQFWLLKRYLRESGVSAQLSVRIHNYCDYVWSSQEQRVQESSVQVLSLLSTSLRSELATAIYEPRLSSHPFFVLIGKVAPMTIRFMCSTALSRTSLGRGDCLFSTQEMASQMWFVCAGQLMYYMDEEDPEEVEEDMWLCEPVLWVTEWTHRGTVQVQLEAELVAVDADKFGTCLHSNLDARFEAAMYCKGFIQNLNRAMTSRLSDLYRTPLIEGLWFRLMNEHKSKPQAMNKSKSGVLERRNAAVGHRPDLLRQFSKTLSHTLSGGGHNNCDAEDE